MHLVIVESPAKAKTINQYLGPHYLVKSSIGHIRHLTDYPLPNPKTATKEEKLFAQLGIYPDTWTGHYTNDPNKTKVIQELKQLAKQCDTIYLATDLDREGEAISWHLQQLLGKDNTYHRITFNEITKEAIQKAMQHPRQVDMGMVHAQFTRQFLDKMVGYMVSPVLWKIVQRGLSAGRVQSPATRLVVEKEKTIRDFLPETYWEIYLLLTQQQDKKTPFKGKLVKYQDQPLDITDKTIHDKVIGDIDALQQVSVIDISEKETTSKPKAPYTTSTLQQAASTYLGFSVKDTMYHAQKLYEKGYITYMRTDSTHLSEEALTSIREEISKVYGQVYLTPYPIVYTPKNKAVEAQEAHEAIRPSDITKDSHDLHEVEEKSQQLYRLIKANTLACQMVNARYLVTTVSTTGIREQDKDYQFDIKGKVTLFEGYQLAWKGFKKDDKEEEQVLPPGLHVGELLDVQDLQDIEKQTKPPARYNEASLVKQLEKLGIGRPSTYATILTTIQQRGYVQLEKKAFHACKVGEVVTYQLQQGFKSLLDYDFTASLEQQLDLIAEGQLDYKTVLHQFYQSLKQQVDQALSDQGLKKLPSRLVKDCACPTCRRPFALRFHDNQAFLGCSGYSDKANPCKTIKPILPYTEEDQQDPLHCPHCLGKAQLYYLSDKEAILACLDDITCRQVRVLPAPNNNTWKIPVNASQSSVESDIPCEVCHSMLERKQGRYGAYMHCKQCNTNRSLDKEGNLLPVKPKAIEFPELPCKNKKSYFVLRESLKGYLFLGSKHFPKVREMREVKVRELIQFKDRLPDHLHYLTLGPVQDEEGNETVVRYSKKRGEKYIGSISKVTGKPSPYQYYWDKGGLQWVLLNKDK